MFPRSREEMFSISQHQHLHSLSPTTGKSDIPEIKGKRVKNNVTSIKKISYLKARVKRGSDYESILQNEGVLSDRRHYEIKQNSIIEETKRKRRKSALSFIEGNATQKERIPAFDEKVEGRTGLLRPTKTWNNPHKLKSKHFLSAHNQSVKSTPRTFLESRVVKRGGEKKDERKEKGGRLKECSLQDLRTLITKMIDIEISKKLAKGVKQVSTTKIVEKRKVKKQENAVKKKSNDVLVLRLKELKTMTHSLVPSSDTVEDSNYETEKKLHPLRNINLQTTQSLALLKNLVNISFEEELETEQVLGSVEDVAASRIKRAWKHFRTQRIIQQYASIFEQNQNEEKGRENEGEGVIYYQGEEKFLSEEGFSINDSFGNLTNRSHERSSRYKYQNRLEKRLNERPNNIPSKRTEIKSLQDALIFIKEELGVESPNTILHNLINGIQEQREIEQEEEEGEEREKQKRDLPQIKLDGNSKIGLGMFDQDLVQSQSLNDSITHNRWDFLSGIKDLELITDGFEKRERSLIKRREEEIQVIDRKLKEKRIGEKEHREEVKKVEAWTRSEISSLHKIRKSLQRGLSDAAAILDKNESEGQFQSIKKNPGLKKCLSNQYIKHIKVEDILPSPQTKELQNKNLQLSNSAQLKRLKKKLDSANNREKSFPSDQQFFSEQLKLIDEFKSQESEEEDYEHQTSIASMQEKLKNLDVEEKDDIFQFAFLDLCIEFCQEIYCDQDHMKIALDYISKSKKKTKVVKNRGIKTNLNTVKEYLRQLKAFVNRTDPTVYRKIKDPLGPTAKEMLKYMHYSEEEFKQKDDYDISSTLVLVTTVFENFENNILPGIEIEPYYSDQAKEKSRVKFLKDIIHIHNKAIFDCLNESLDQERPFGMWGAPFPWKVTSKFSPPLTAEDLEEKYGKAEERVVQCCSYFCGLLVDKEDSLISPGTKISAEYLEQVKEDRLSRMLAADLLEGEERWLFYDDEETETLVEISHIVYEILVRETITDLRALFLPFDML